MGYQAYIRIEADGSENTYYEFVPDPVNVQQHSEVNVDDGKVKIDGDHDSNAPIVIKRTLTDGHPYIKCEDDSGAQTFAVDGDGDMEVKGHILMQQRADGTTGAIATQGLVSLQGNSALLYQPYNADGTPMSDEFEMRFGRAKEIGDSSHDQDGLKMNWGNNRGTARELLINPLGQTPAFRVNSARTGETKFMELSDNVKDVFTIDYQGKIRSDQIQNMEADDDLLEILVDALDRRVTQLELPAAIEQVEGEPGAEGHRAQKKRASAPNLDSLQSTQRRLNNYIDVSQEDIHTLQADQDDIVDDIRDMSLQLSAVKTDVESNDIAIASNTSNITTNSTNIGTNTTNIGTNTTSIGTNTSNITTNTSSISTNTSNIATNTSSISTNTSSIATNTTNITTNANAITALQSGGGSSSNPSWWLNDSDAIHLTYTNSYTSTNQYFIPISSIGKLTIFNWNESVISGSQSCFVLPHSTSELSGLTAKESHFKLINMNWAASSGGRIQLQAIDGGSSTTNTVTIDGVDYLPRIMHAESSAGPDWSVNIFSGEVVDIIWMGVATRGTQKLALWWVYRHNVKP